MLTVKSSFGITSNEHFVFILGGFNAKKSSSCEKFDIIKNIWISIKNLNFCLSIYWMMYYQEKYNICLNLMKIKLKMLIKI